MCEATVVVQIQPSYESSEYSTSFHYASDSSQLPNRMKRKVYYCFKVLAVLSVFLLSNILLVKMAMREAFLYSVVVSDKSSDKAFTIFAETRSKRSLVENDSPLIRRMVRRAMLEQRSRVAEMASFHADHDNERQTELDDIFIGVKTTGKFHKSRLPLLMDTWTGLARDQTYFFSDSHDEKLNKRSNGHFINTNCPSGHNRRALCCKMSYEFDMFIRSGKRWFCHVDDDTYLNVYQLLSVLRRYNHTQNYYLGRPSLNRPLEIRDRQTNQKIAFWFATGGAGVCLSRSMAKKMLPHASGGKLISQCENIRLPDDVTLGYVIEHIIGEQLTVIPEFHSHLEALWAYKESDLRRMVTFSYSNVQPDKLSTASNVLDVSGFSQSSDPTRLRSAHCHIYSYLPQCQQMMRRR